MQEIAGIQVFVETIKGDGDLNFVLLHNAGTDHHFFTPQIDFLTSFGNVTWLDFPGCGKSEPMENYSIRDMANIVEELCISSSLKNICLIGLNSGANIAIEMTLQKRVDIQKLVMIDPIFMDTSFRAEIEGFIKVLDSGGFHEEFIQMVVKDLFLSTTKDNENIAIRAFRNVNHKALSQIFHGLLDWDLTSRGRLHEIICPSLCILTDEHHCTFDEIRKEAPHFEIGKTVGCKCWATLEVPDQVNSMISRFLSISKSQA